MFNHRSDLLFPLPERRAEDHEPQIADIKRPIWTENKAKLIARYLYYFLMITKHGAYIDGFAGPQERDKPDTWAAKLVLELKPAWLRQFHLFEIEADGLRNLKNLKATYSDRVIELYPGDFNVRIHDLLNARRIREKEATFCLLDQRTFECHWSTVRAISEYKKEGRKIELFYFFPIAWLRRAVTALKNYQKLRDWWGRDDWPALLTMTSETCKEQMVSRFRDELNYWSVKAWPIYRDPQGRAIMYYMIHATDHDKAPEQMTRAYNFLPPEPSKQLSLLDLT
jgi:three-Cys-motif partner protein